MRKIISYQNLLAFLILIGFGCKSSVSENLIYIDENKPGDKPTIFSKGFISKQDRAEFGSVFNRRGDEFFYADDTNGKAKIMTSKIINNFWTEPRAIIQDGKFSFNDPFLSTDEKKLFYISDKPRNEKDTIKDYDIWYSNRIGTNWSEPINAGSNINSDSNEYYISFTNEGTMYFASNKNKGNRKHDFDIYKSQIFENEFGKAKKLNDSINSKRYEAEGFISPDESLIIFSSARKDGFGSGDLYFSVKNKDDEWTKAKNMGPIINSEHNEICPFITYDKRFLFFSRNQDIYWMNIEFLTPLKESDKSR